MCLLLFFIVFFYLKTCFDDSVRGNIEECSRGGRDKQGC